MDDYGGTISTKPSKIGVCGDLVGGSLAAMLALTECATRASKGVVRGITALAAGNPIVDWTAFFELDSDSSSMPGPTRYQRPPDFNRKLKARDLLELRNIFFRKPETYFDPFASPLLFFRTPSADLPNDFQASLTKESDSDSEAKTGSVEHLKKRRSHRKYPPSGMDLILPHMRIELGKDDVLRDQGIELIELVRKSFKRTEEESFNSGASTIKRYFEVIEKEDLVLSDKQRMLEIGQWFGDVLRRP